MKNAQYTVESKNALARMLATENIETIHGSYETASFDIKNRILRLPSWSSDDSDVVDMLIGHEVGHALFTPLEGWHEAATCDERIPKSYLNVLEDNRIESLIQKRYPGLVSNFQKGYQKLIEQGFFGEYDTDNLLLIDKINLKAKAKDPNIHFENETEQDFYNRSMKLNDWDEVVVLAKEILEYERDKQEDPEQDHDEPQMPQMEMGDDDESDEMTDNDSSDSSDSSDSNDDSGENEQDKGDTGDSDEADDSDEDSGDDTDSADDTDSGETEGSSEADDDSDEDSNEESDKGSNNDESDKTDESESGGNEGSGDSDETETGNESDNESASTNSDLTAGDSGAPKEKDLESKTDKNFRENEHKLVDSDGSTVRFTNFSRESYRDQTVDYKNWLADYREVHKGHDAYFNKVYKFFLQNNKNLLNSMCQKFEMKKRASMARKARPANTGKIDNLKLHSYKFDDNIFKSIMIQDNGQNHGIAFIVDLSGSMNHIIGDVVQQVVVLTEFCRKQNIKFDVYGFTTCFKSSMEINREDKIKKFFETRKSFDNIIMVHNCNIIQMLSSEMSKKDYHDACKYMLIEFNGAYGFYNGNPADKGLITHEQQNSIKTEMREVGIHNRNYRWNEDQELTNKWAAMSTKFGKDTMGGTPLHEIVLAAHYISSEMIKKHRIDKMSTIFLTDGCGSQFTTSRDYFDGTGNRNYGSRSILASAETMEIMIPELNWKITVNKDDDTYCFNGDSIMNALINSLSAITRGPVINIDLIRQSQCHMNVVGTKASKELKSKKCGFLITDKKDLKKLSSVPYYFDDKIGYDRICTVNIDKWKHNRNKDKSPTAENTAVQIKNSFINQQNANKSANVIFNSIVEQVATGL